MERADESWGRESVTSELNEGIKLANKLKNQLHQHSINNSSSDCGFLIEKIVSCYDNALALLGYMGSLQNGVSTTNFLDFTPTTEVSVQLFKDGHVFADVPKKRKNLARWSEEVHVCSGLEGQHEDGYYWRKYGQKDILGATHPRSYYRCTHRRTQGCLATKQVQRGEDDPCIFKVVYRGKHACVLKHNIQNVNDELIKHQNVAPQLNLTSQSYNLSHSFLNSESLPLGDFDFLIDDEVNFDLSPFFSHVQDSPATS